MLKPDEKEEKGTLGNVYAAEIHVVIINLVFHMA